MGSVVAGINVIPSGVPGKYSNYEKEPGLAGVGIRKIN